MKFSWDEALKLLCDKVQSSSECPFQYSFISQFSSQTFENMREKSIRLRV